MGDTTTADPPQPHQVEMFWHGPALSRVERLCMSSFVANGHRVRLHVYEEPEGVPEGVSLSDAARVLPASSLFAHAKTGSVALFSDWFRYRLLYEQGGLWVDTDVVCLRPFHYAQPEIFAWQDETAINNAVLGLPAGHEVAHWMAQCCEHPNRLLPYDTLKMRRRKILRRLRHGNNRAAVKWGESGPGGLTAAARHLGYIGHGLPFWHFYPIHYLNWRTVFDATFENGRSFLDASSGLHLWNEMARRAGFDKNARYRPGSLFEQLCARYLKSDS